MARPPGVHPVDAFPTPEPALLTGVPAFLGPVVANPGPPRRVALWPQFTAEFGTDLPGFVAAAVHGFFANDGGYCHVVPLDERASPRQRIVDGLAALDGQDDIDLVCAPDLMAGPGWAPDSALRAVASPWRAGTPSRPHAEVTQLQEILTAHCADRGDRFAILDAVPATAPAAVAEQAAVLSRPYGGYGALYHPWLRTRTGSVPPCGHLAGVYSRGDRRVGVHKAPANEPLADVLDLVAAPTGAQVGALYAAGVNCVRAFPARGIRVWGARTLGDPAGRRDIGARRVVGTVHRWIERFMAGLVHEPNDVRLWVRMMRELTAYLDGLYAAGALRGRTAGEAFYVKCDHETNPAATVAAGLVVTEVGLAPSVPAEYVVVRVVHGAGGVAINAM
ncbi:phage tail sheath family protein [Pseudonocardia sp.]|uniref:phage tail sheath family protein n=1 Tax=Pseudonocardia sp. TaxID=60912 RepID=UPI003D0D2507